MQIEIFKSEKNQNYYFTIRANNGQTVAQSEGYREKRNAAKTARSLKWRLLFAKIVEV